MTLPRYIALCGNPGSGKSTAQKILRDQLRVLPVDDGGALRSFAVENLGMSHIQVSTQAGKRETVQIAGQTWEVRKALGELGNAIEATFGPHILPFIAMQRAERELRGTICQAASFGSVRRDQGRCYQRAGGVVIGIHNPLTPPSGNEFDTFDYSVVDAWILNDGPARGLTRDEAMADLELKLIRVVRTLSRLADTRRAA